jgi:hypothetical protein
MAEDILAATTTHYVTNHVTAEGQYDGFNVVCTATGQIVGWSWWYKKALNLMFTGQLSKVGEPVHVTV